MGRVSNSSRPYSIPYVGMQIQHDTFTGILVGGNQRRHTYIACTAQWPCIILRLSEQTAGGLLDVRRDIDDTHRTKGWLMSAKFVDAVESSVP